MKELEVLLNKRWILKSRDKEMYYKIRDALGELRKFTTEKMGCQIIDNSLLIKMEKIPVIPESFMGIQKFSSKEEYAYLCILLMFLEDRDAQEQFILSQLTEYITANLPGEISDWTLYTNRRKLIRVLRFAVDQGIVDVTDGKDEAYLKLYDGHDWKWFRVYLKRTDMEYLRRNWKGKKASAPALEKRHRRYFLRFSYTEEVTLTKTPVKEQIICSVDLGINTDAVCTIMRSDGTVLGRRFIDHPSEKDRMYRTLGRIRRFQREHGSAQTQGRWAYTKRLNTELGKKTAGAIVRYAEENHADVIVFEYLEMQGKISGKKKQKLHLWRKRDIQRRCEHQAHRKEMRISRICAWNTSRLAYDGSGAVTRDRENHSLCTFQTGKRYNCDLSASYNIGARYFIRELLKPLPATERSLLEAKVPPVKRRTSCVYADLRKLHSEMERLKAA